MKPQNLNWSAWGQTGNTLKDFPPNPLQSEGFGGLHQISHPACFSPALPNADWLDQVMESSDWLKIPGTWQYEDLGNQEGWGILRTRVGQLCFTCFPVPTHLNEGVALKWRSEPGVLDQGNMSLPGGYGWKVTTIPYLLPFQASHGDVECSHGRSSWGCDLIAPPELIKTCRPLHHRVLWPLTPPFC